MPPMFPRRSMIRRSQPRLLKIPNCQVECVGEADPCRTGEVGNLEEPGFGGRDCMNRALGFDNRGRSLVPFLNGTLMAISCGFSPARSRWQSCASYQF